jgi:hypothetical protein
VDDETSQTLRELAAREHGLPQELARRVNGDSISAMRKDARQLALDLGFAAPQPRASGGQFASFSDEIRAAAGRAPTEAPEPVGDLGVGRGGSASPRQPRPPDMSSLIRAAREVRRSGVVDLAEQLAEEAG